MPKTTLNLLFDAGQLFQESWELTDGLPGSLLPRVREIAQARLPLLASSVRIVLLKAQGCRSERVDLQGTGGAFAEARYGLTMLNDGRSTRIVLRGVPTEIYARDRLTDVGIKALEMFSTTLNRCGVVVVCNGQTVPLTRLWPRRQTLSSHMKGQKATLRKLTAVLGEDKAKQFWAELKEQDKARPSTATRSET